MKMKQSMQLTLVYGLVISLTVGSALSARADDEQDKTPQEPPQIEQEQPADQPETPEQPQEPSETPQPTDTPEPANPPVKIDYDLLNLAEPPAQPTEETPAETPAPTPENNPPTETVVVPDNTPSEPPQVPPPAAPEPQAVACKVVVVDPVARTITVEASGQLHLLKIDRQVKIMKKGKLVSLDDVVSGQEVVVLARTETDGTIQVVSLAIGPGKVPAQAAGKGDTASGGYKHPLLNFPFSSFPNPANIGPVVDSTPVNPVVTPNN